MEKIYKGEIQRLLPIFKAMAEGKTIQFAVSDEDWVDVDGDEDGFSLQTLIDNTQSYRIKPGPKYRPFKNAEECWQEMLKHQPFGWVKSTLFKDLALVQKVTTLYVEIDRDIIDYKDTLEKFTFADGTPFGVKEE